MIDLHTHSTASDGTLPPSSLVATSQRAGLLAVALTDHDTLSGVSEFISAGLDLRMEVVSGVEIACSWYGFSLHLLGLFIDHENIHLESLLAGIRQGREQRNQQILERLQNLGISLSLDAVIAESGSREQAVIGRPHFAQALVRGHHCADLRQAFNLFLGRSGKAYVRRFLPLPKVVIEAIHLSGGVAVLAHPFGGTTQIVRNRTRQKLQRLISMGLDGMEVFYCDYTPEQQATAVDLASELGLLQSGGSDFHGGNTPGVQLGCGYGKLSVGDHILPPLRERSQKYR